MPPTSPANAARNRKRNRRKPELHPANPAEDVPIRDTVGKFTTGKSGNPRGKPYGAVSFVVALRRRLTEHPEEAEKILRELIHMASQKGPNQLPAIKEILDRVDGKPTEHHVVEGETPMRLIFVPAEPLPPPTIINPIYPWPPLTSGGTTGDPLPPDTIIYSSGSLQTTLT